MAFMDKFKNTIKNIKFVLSFLVIIFLLITIGLYMFNGITVSKGITEISPVNISQNGFFCKTKSVTAARSSSSGSFIISNSGLKYNILDSKIYDYLESNIGKSLIVNYEKRAYYHNPCMTSEYIITGIK